MRKAFLLVGACGLVSSVLASCMSRPVVETEPRTSNLYVEPIRNDAIDKLDLLFMIDNSRSMGDKQRLLAEAVPRLVNRLVVPRCVDASGSIRERAATTEACPVGFEPEFRAVNDIHIGVITSSLGAHGAPQQSAMGQQSAVCRETSPDNDRALLLPSVRPGLTSYQNKGFLAWDPEQEAAPPGEADARRLNEQFASMVTAAGENGCGYEASLEAWYRFLVDPEPPRALSVADGRTVVQEIDTELLAQRAEFLRPDSLVAIVMLTDENDCSVRDDGYGHWLASTNATLPRGSSACDRDPNDPCCVPCGLTSGLPAGCMPVDSDPACQQMAEQSPNMRCYDNQRRFGYDFLHPVSRYVNAITQPLVERRSTGELVENPLYAAAPGKLRRTPDLVYLAGIVGVPWQDIADEESLTGPGLRYLTATQLTERGRWDVIVGDRSKNQRPADPFMHEQSEPRSGVNPVTQAPIVAETSTDPRANPINGHEQADKDRNGRPFFDLQYACTFPLQEPFTCEDDTCDCQADAEDSNRPLCQPPGGGPAGTTQYFGKAYPGLRPLEVLEGIGDSAIVASICPKVLTPGQPGYGYEPAVEAIVDRLKVALEGRCPPRPLAVAAEADGKLPCAVVEAQPPQATCSCSTAGRSPASAAMRAMVEREVRESEQCDTPSTPACRDLCFCEIAQATGDNLEQCLNSTVNTATPGYCYVDPFGDPPVGNPEFVKKCEPANKRLIRFVGPDTPAPGAPAYIACLGATLH